MSLTRSAIRAQIAALFFLLLLAFNATAVVSKTSTLAGTLPSFQIGWNPVAATNVAGYAVYYGTNSGVYTKRIDVGTNTIVTLTNLQPGLTYYITVIDYNGAGVESPYSPEISILVPGLVVAQTVSANNVLIRFPVYPPHWYEIQASTDLKTWTSIATTAAVTQNVWMSISDTNAGAYKNRYYRSRAH